MRVCVYAASSERVTAAYGAAAEATGQFLAAEGWTVVFGGGGRGLMGRLATGAIRQGGRVVGVMPRFMRELEWAHPGVQEWVWTETMAERKEALLAGAGAVVALPGGCGTLEELLEVVTLKRLALWRGPVVVVNLGGFFSPLLEQLERCIAEGFMDPRHRSLWKAVGQPDEVVAAVRAAPDDPVDARSFAVPRMD